MQKITVQDLEELKVKFDKYCETAEQHEFIFLDLVDSRLNSTIEFAKSKGEIENQALAKSIFRVILKKIGEPIPEYLEE